MDYQSRLLKCGFSTLLASLVVVALLALPGRASAALESRLGGLAVYDTDLNITWAADANINGLMDWAAANSWAAGLTIGGIGGWRLPTSDTCSGPNCTGGEMGHLFYTELGGTVVAGFFFPSISATAAGFSNLQLNPNLQLNHLYWSGTEYAPDTSAAWIFDTGFGLQHPFDKTSDLYALAVRSGDVAAAIPEPETYAMMLAGLGLMGFVARRRKQKEAA